MNSKSLAFLELLEECLEKPQRSVHLIFMSEGRKREHYFRNV